MIYIPDKFIKKDADLNRQRNYFERKVQELADQINLNLRNKHNMDGHRIYNLGDPVDNTDATNKQFVEDHKNDMGGEKIINVGDPTQPTDGVNKLFVDEEIRSIKSQKYNMEGHALTNVGYPGNLNDAATKDYVDTELLFFDGFSGVPGRLRKIENIAPPTEANDVSTKEYVDQIYATITENKNDMGGERISNVGNPTQPTDGANKQYIDKRLRNLKEPIKLTDGANKGYIDNETNYLYREIEATNADIRYLQDFIFHKGYVQKLILNNPTTQMNNRNVIELVGVEVNTRGNLQMFITTELYGEETTKTISIDVTKPDGQFISLIYSLIFINTRSTVTINNFNEVILYLIDIRHSYERIPTIQIHNDRIDDEEPYRNIKN